jgi:hypothetical protein
MFFIWMYLPLFFVHDSREIIFEYEHERFNHMQNSHPGKTSGSELLLVILSYIKKNQRKKLWF